VLSSVSLSIERLLYDVIMVCPEHVEWRGPLMSTAQEIASDGLNYRDHANVNVNANADADANVNGLRSGLTNSSTVQLNAYGVESISSAYTSTHQCMESIDSKDTLHMCNGFEFNSDSHYDFSNVTNTNTNTNSATASSNLAKLSWLWLGQESVTVIRCAYFWKRDSTAKVLVFCF
jgi:hypothetical protein